MSGTGDPRERRRWSCSLLVVLSLHAGAAATAALLNAPAVSPRQSAAPTEAVMLTLAPRPVAPPPLPQVLPSGPPQVERPPTPAPRPRPEPSDVPDPNRPPETEPPPEHDTSPEVQRTTAPPPSPLPPADVAAAAQPARAPGDDALATWESRLLAHLEAHQHYPARARSNRQQGVVFVRLSIGADGRVLAHALERSSGHRLLDEEALAAVLRAQPLPPPDEGASTPVERIIPLQFIYRR